MDTDRAEYIRAIEEVFFELRGRGFMLSPRDVALADQWRTGGVPVRVVARALHTGAQAWAERNPAGATAPASLAYFRGHVERAAALYRERAPASVAAQTRAADPDAAAAERAVARKALADAVVAAGKRQPEAAIKEVLRDVWRGLEAAAAEPEAIWALAERLDTEMCVAALAACTQEVRDAVERAGLDAVPPERAAVMSPRALDNRRQAARVARIRAMLDLPDLIRILRDADA